MKKIILPTIALCFLALPATAEKNKSNNETTKLYRLDCGNINVSDLNVFSDTMAYVGKTKELVASCYIIKHGDKILLWDTGLPDSMVDQAVQNGPFHLSKSETITQQLAKLELTPNDVTHVAISHAHFDHAGTLGLFSESTLIIQKEEFDFVKNNPEDAANSFMPAENFTHFFNDENKGQLNLLNGDVDIFGDGVAQAIKLPGHTPGHMALLLNLKSGSVILSGDQWHFDENHDNNGVPSFNFDRADTLGSSDKLNAIIKNTNATLIIQHEPKDKTELPELPNYLE